VLCVGQAGGRGAISIERVAINVDDARIPDAAGRSPIDAPIVAGGPAAYFSTLPIKRLRAALAKAGIPAEVSQTAGTYVCNHVFYGLMHALKRRPGVRGGFVHIPYSPEQVRRHPDAPSLATANVVDALRILLRESLKHVDDLPLPMDAMH
jgi:pyroglutamyl-peptidase